MNAILNPFQGSTGCILEVTTCSGKAISASPCSVAIIWNSLHSGINFLLKQTRSQSDPKRHANPVGWRVPCSRLTPEHPILIPINISINILIDIESIENIEYFNIFVIDYFFKNIDLIIDLVIDLVIEF